MTRNLGDNVEIRIRDNGTGIPPEVKEKLFGPFFTTKPDGEGTGLGLSISHDIIVKQHGGCIEVDTQPGEFTEFRIVLPRAGLPYQVRTTRVNLLILVVDDEPDVEGQRKTISSALSRSRVRSRQSPGNCARR
jgi:hypothetical protein